MNESHQVTEDEKMLLPSLPFPWHCIQMERENMAQNGNSKGIFGQTRIDFSSTLKCMDYKMNIPNLDIAPSYVHK